MSEETKTCVTQTMIPELTVDDGAKAIEFYEKAFGAVDHGRIAGPHGRGIMHAELSIGGFKFFLNDELPGMGHSPRTLGGSAGSIYLYVDDVDETFRRAIDAGASEAMAPEDMFWGDRMASVVDPAGHQWGLATHKEDVSEEELQKRLQTVYAQMEAEPDAEVEASL